MTDSLIERNCSLCQQNSATLVYPARLDSGERQDQQFSARRPPDGLHYPYKRCNTCGLLYASPALAEADAQRLYRRSHVTYNDEQAHIIASYLAPLIPYMQTRKRVLEIGCGDGFFLDALKRTYNVEVDGVEPSITARDNASRNFGINLKQDLAQLIATGTKFDLVCCFQTLDHLYHPDQMLQQIAMCLTENALVYLIVHDEQALSARLLGRRSPIFDIQHMCLFNKKTLLAFVLAAGFYPIKQFNVWNRYSLKYWLHLLGIQTTSGFLSRHSLRLPPGNIGILARSSK